MSRGVDGAFDRLAAFWHAPQPAERLAVLRILTGLFATVYVLGRVTYFAGYAKLSPQQFAPIGVVSILTEPLPPAAPWVITIVAIVSGACFTVGYRYRITAPVFGATLLWVLTYRSSWGMIFHTENLLCLHVLALSLAPRAADAYSLDSRETPPPSPNEAYGWPIQLMCAVTVLAYFVAGVTKVKNSGASWFTSDLLQHYVAYDSIRKAELGSIHSSIGAYLSENHPAIFKPAAAFSLALELGAPIVLFVRRLAPFWVAGIVLFHLGVLIVMAILFPYPLFLIGFASFFPVEKLAARAVARWKRGRGTG